MCSGSFGLYASYVAGILNSAKEINFYVLCDKHVNYAKYIETCIAGKSALLSYLQNTILDWLK
jgi:hypothetical protein